MSNYNNFYLILKRIIISFIELRCKPSYLKIIDSTDTDDVCGTERKFYYNKFCSNQVYITYKADEKQLNSKFKGFRLYYESIISFF